MALTKALLKKIAESRATAGGNNIKDGDYILVVKRLLVDQKYKGTMFIAEFDVVESAQTREDVTPNAPNSDCSIALNLDTNASAPGNMKQFFLGLLGKDEATTPTEELIKDMEKYTGEDNKARGMLVACSTYRKVTKTGPNAGKEGTYPRWARVSETEGNTEDAIKARRAELDEKQR